MIYISQFTQTPTRLYFFWFFLKYHGMVTSVPVWNYFHLCLINLNMCYYGYGLIHMNDPVCLIKALLENNLHNL